MEFFDKIRHSFMIKIVTRVAIEGRYCNILLLHSRERKRQQAWFYRKKWEGGMADTWG